MSVFCESSSTKPVEVIIISNAKYKDLPEKIENELDITKLLTTFGLFNITPTVHKEQTLEQIRELMLQLKRADFSNRRALLMIIITNGETKGRVHAQDEMYELESEIFQPIINNETLTDKPKAFIIEANRGFMEYDNISHDAIAFGRKPNEIIKLFSNYEGYKSYCTSEGSCLIQCFCNTLAEHGSSHDIKWIFQNVQEIVPSISGQKAFPVVESNMRAPFLIV